MINENFIEFYTVSFLGFITGKKSRPGFYRRPFFSNLLTIAEIIAFIICRIFFCGADYFLGYGQNVFTLAFLIIDFYGLFASVPLALFLLILKSGKILFVLNEISSQESVLINIRGRVCKRKPYLKVCHMFCLIQAFTMSAYVLGCRNGYLGDCYNCSTISMFYIHQNFMINLFFCVLVINIHYIIFNINECILFFSESSEKSVNPGILRALTCVHRSIVNAAENLNKSFTEINLVFFLVEFVIWVNTFSYLLYNEDLILNNACWVLFYCSNSILRCFQCGVLYLEADKTAKYLNELFIGNDDEKIRDEIEVFSLQLLHTELRFDACGFFKIDFSLLNSMIAAVTTYIVILMQFQIAGKPCLEQSK